jgi:uncharacterized protein (TIGR03435 family)
MCILAAVGYTQTFEVVSVRETDPKAEQRGPLNIESHPGTVTMRGVRLGEVIFWSYKISPFQVSNVQNVMGPDRFDITAKAAGPAKTDEMRIMMQAMLADRFKMVSHRETKEMSAYALVEAKGGHKLKPSQMDDGSGVLPLEGQRMALGGQSATLDQLGMFLSGPLRTPVVDMTGLKGRWDFEIDITSYGIKGPRTDGEPPPDPVSVLQDALPKQLGLRLEARKLPIEMLIIDKVQQKPVEN